MKKIQLIGAFVLSSLFLVLNFTSCNSNSASTVAGETIANATASFTVEGMTCEMGCAKTIEETVTGLPGVKKCVVNFKEKKATVEVDDAKFSKDALLAAVQGVNEGQYSIKDFELKKNN